MELFPLNRGFTILTTLNKKARTKVSEILDICVVFLFQCLTNAHVLTRLNRKERHHKRDTNMEQSIEAHTNRSGLQSIGPVRN